ncbi:MAG: hypothetical protein GWP06_09990 [Actinobacteria bacterium]|nr:hypothetical protein [Actinomycetota bacterium]
MSRKSLRKRIKNTVIYFLVLFFVKFIRFVPRRVGIAMMRTLGRIAFLAAKNERRKTIRHLTFAFGKEKSPKEIKALARRVFLHFSTAAVDAIRIPVFVKKGINRFVSTENMHYAENARDAKKGPIILTAHFGNWELMGAWLAQNGFPLHVIGTSAYDPRLDKMIVKTRNGAGYKNIARGKNTREIIRVLRQGIPLGILIDQDTRVEGVFVDFFGRKAHTATGLVVLAQKFDVPIVPIFIRLKKNLHYHIECFPPIELEDTGNAEKDLVTNTQKCSDAIERMVRRYPEQWVWMHERWKKQPGRK